MRGLWAALRLAEEVGAGLGAGEVLLRRLPDRSAGGGESHAAWSGPDLIRPTHRHQARYRMIR